jgi:rhodanese-related sulfurtransferase
MDFHLETAMSFARKMSGVIGAIALMAATLPALAGDWDTVPEKKATALKLYMHPKDAQARMAGPEAGKTLFIDVRTPQEAMFVGMASPVDANIPYMVMPELPEWDVKKNVYKLVPNSNFLSAVVARLEAKGLNKDDAVILMCRSGDRSATAANLLAKAGFTQVYSVLEGFEGDMSKEGRRAVNGWKNDGLPWSYELSRDKMSAL